MLVVGLLVLTACQPVSLDAPTVDEGVVTSIIDGDTIEVAQASGSTTMVRLAGINAPESGECHFTQARDHLIDEILGHGVVLETIGTDRFGRTLAFISIEDIVVNEDLVGRGHAISLTPDPDTPYGERLLRAEEEAAEANRGLWADDVCGAEGPIPAVQVTTVEFDPDGPDEEELDQELVVISNEGSSVVDIGNWVLRDESSLHRHLFRPGTQLLPGASLTVTSASLSWEPGGGPVWNNDGDLILLMDRSGRVVHAVRY